MAYRNQRGRQNNNIPSPWIQGAPPGSMQQQQQQQMGFNPGMNQTAMGQGGFNQITSQLALANNILSSAFSKNQGMYADMNQGRGLLGSAPQNFQMHGGSLMGRPGILNNMGPDVKRMRMNNQGSYNQRMRNQPAGRSNFDFQRRNRNRERERERERNREKERREKHSDRNDKTTSSPTKKDKESDVKKKSTEKKNDESKIDDDDDAPSYDPASPTSDVGGKEKKDTENGEKRESDSPEVMDGAKNENEAGNTLQVTIGQHVRGRSVSKNGDTGSGSAATETSIFCHVCNLTCSTHENFRRHMNSRGHKASMDKVITLHEVKTKQIEARMKESAHKNDDDKERKSKKDGYCNLCKISYVGSLIEHRRAKEHKAFEEKKRKRGDNDEDGDNDEVDEPYVDPNNIPAFDPNKTIGQSYVVPLSGLFCKLCRKFYKDDQSAQQHCQTQLHYDNFKKQILANKRNEPKDKDVTTEDKETPKESEDQADAEMKEASEVHAESGSPSAANDEKEEEKVDDDAAAATQKNGEQTASQEDAVVPECDKAPDATSIEGNEGSNPLPEVTKSTNDNADNDEVVEKVETTRTRKSATPRGRGRARRGRGAQN